VVATAVGGVPDLITSGVHGLLVERGDWRGLAAAVGRLLRDREEAEAMGRRGRERQRRELDLDTTVRRLERLYEDLHAIPHSARGGSEAARAVLEAHR
jgi:glycosyltransferase involved in cell wall biosynthesis